MLPLLLAVSLQPAVPVAPDPVLRWSAPPGCPEQPNVEARIVQYVGDMPPAGTATIEAEVTPTADGKLFLRVAVNSASGTTEHSLTSERCEVLADAVALVAAVALDPLETAAAVEHRRAPPEPEPEPEPEPIEPEPEPETPAGDEGEDGPRSLAEPNPGIRRFPRLRLGLRPDFVVDWGPLPAVAIGGSFSGALIGQHWRVELGPVFLAGRSAASSIAPSATALVSLTAVDARGCGVLRSRNRVVEGPLCAGIELGTMRGRGTGSTSSPQDRRKLWTAATLSPGVAFVPRYWLAIVFGADVVVPLSRVAFEIGDEQVHRARPAGIRGRFGLEVRVP